MDAVEDATRLSNRRVVATRSCPRVCRDPDLSLSIKLRPAVLVSTLPTESFTSSHMADDTSTHTPGLLGNHAHTLKWISEEYHGKFCVVAVSQGKERVHV